jgi:hypothetical protein
MGLREARVRDLKAFEAAFNLLTLNRAIAIWRVSTVLSCDRAGQNPFVTSAGFGEGLGGAVLVVTGLRRRADREQSLRR